VASGIPESRRMSTEAVQKDMNKLLVTALLVLSLPAAAFAETAVGVSIETQVADSDLVVRARFLRRTDIGSAGFSVCSYRVEETLLGEPRKHQDVLARDFPEDGAVKGGEYLLFLDRHCRQFTDSATAAAAADRTPFELREQIRLDAPVEVFTMACKKITDRAALLEVVRAAARYTKNATMRAPTHMLEVPTDAPAYYGLYGGSAVYMAVPVDSRFARLARKWQRAKYRMRREAGAEGLRIVAARALSLERIAGRFRGGSGRGPGQREGLAERLEKAEAGIAAVRASVRRALEGCKDSDLQKSLLRIRLSRLSRGPEDRAAWVKVLAHDFDAIGAAARGSLWRVVIENRREGADRILTLCERIEGRIAFNVLRLRGWQNKTLQYVITVEERLYCFAGKSVTGRPVAGYVDHIVFARGGLLRDTLQGRVEPRDGRGIAHTVPAGMQLVRLHLSPKNLRHWIESSYIFTASAPIWSAPFLFGEFRDAFPPRAANRKGEADPKPMRR